MTSAAAPGPATCVVVGHGMVGHRFVQELRERDADNSFRVVVLSEEPVAAYDRVGLSGYVGSWDPTTMALAGNAYPDDDLVEVRLGESAVTVDRDDRRITTSSGAEIGYDALVLATGSYPFVPPVEGKDHPRSFVYRTLADLDAIRATAEAAAPGAPGVVVGGGLLGLEAANALSASLQQQLGFKVDIPDWKQTFDVSDTGQLSLFGGA